MNLTRLAGNAPLKRQLELETARRGLSHAYILSGPAGSGKRTLAGLLAAALVCDRRGGALPCLSCAGCRKAEGGIHPDIVRVGDDGKDISVAQVRALRADAYIRPNEAERKVYILENAQTMNASAQNAMLKLLEEGPAYAAFLLLTDNAAALLPTVRSRCEHLPLSPVTQREAEHWLDEHLPDIIKALAVPFICTIVMVPLTILVIGPVSNVLANAIAAAYNFLANNVPALAAILVGGIWQVFVIFGVHWGVTPMCLANFANYGCDSFQAFQTCAVIAQAAACFGVFLKTKKADIKNVSLSAGLTGIFGITEPAIYGVTLRLKKPFVCGCIGGAIGALIISFFNTKYYVYAGLPGLLTTVNAMSDANPSSFTGMMIGVLATIIITIVLVQVVGCDEKESQKN